MILNSRPARIASWLSIAFCAILVGLLLLGQWFETNDAGKAGERAGAWFVDVFIVSPYLWLTVPAVVLVLRLTRRH